MKMRAVLVLLAIPMSSLAQSEATVKVSFDKALRTSDGALLRTVLRSSDVKGVTPKALTTFLTTYIKPWYEGPSIERRKNGSTPRFNDPQCHLVATFGPAGGFQWSVVDKRTLVFDTPTFMDGKVRKATVTIGQLVFAVASVRANAANRTQIEEIKYGQKLVESWVPGLKKMGIAGSVDPETSKHSTWDQIVAQGRAEIKKIE